MIILTFVYYSNFPMKTVLEAHRNQFHRAITGSDDAAKDVL